MANPTRLRSRWGGATVRSAAAVEWMTGAPRASARPELLVILVTIAAALGIANAQLATSVWPMFLHDPMHTGQSTVNTSASSSTQKWQLSTGDIFSASSPADSSPVVGTDGTIYVG